MAQKYIVGDIVMYGNQIMVIKEPRDGSHFDLLWHKWVVYSNIDIEDIKPVPLTPEILEKNGWDKEEKDGRVFSLSEVFLGGDKDDEDNYTHFFIFYNNEKDGWDIDMRGESLKYGIHHVHELQHLFYGLGINNKMEV